MNIVSRAVNAIKKGLNFSWAILLTIIRPWRWNLRPWDMSLQNQSLAS